MDNVVIGDGIALTLSLTVAVGIVGLTLRGVAGGGGGRGGRGVHLLGHFFSQKFF